jgi:anaerobic dimethyl sulfoxide reductase subunit B (iron-sulfur subunit)
MERQLTFSFDASRCSGCFACVVACRDQNDDVSDAALRSVVRHEAGGCSNAAIAFYSLACMHCGDAPCIMVCPTGALSRRADDGVVDLDRDLCVGCHSCLLACPFGAPRFAGDGKMAKCDLCHLRIEHGLEPACVRVCPTQALGFGNTQALADQKAATAAVQLIRSLHAH